MKNESFPFGYCTNVHAGATLETAWANLQRFSGPVRQQLCPEQNLPIGLWLAADAARDLLQGSAIEDFAQKLHENCFSAYTFNGFPQGDFHQPVVKHEVYKPTWLSEERTNYTISLASILAGLLRDDQNLGSISTLPLGWPHKKWTEEDFLESAKNLHKVVQHLEKIADDFGKEIVIAIEPEPGCVLNTAPEIIEFFERYLFSGENAECARKHLSVCHDICHSGVMFEPQIEAFQSYLDAGIRIGKVQVSSAVHVPFDSQQSDSERDELLAQLRTFNEPKYLHQASRSNDKGKLEILAEDLHLAIDSWSGDAALTRHPWRVHFHVPIFVREFGRLHTTQSDIVEAVQFLQSHGAREVAGSSWFTGHYEVETYAWPVLPESLAETDLASGIARELSFFSELLAESK